MNNEIPKTLKVGGITFDIVEVDFGKFGEVNFSNQEIRLAPCQKQDQKKETLLHEILHCIVIQSGLSERLKSGNKVTDEEIVTAISPLLHTILVDNSLSF